MSQTTIDECIMYVPTIEERQILRIFEKHLRECRLLPEARHRMWTNIEREIVQLRESEISNAKIESDSAEIRNER